MKNSGLHILKLTLAFLLGWMLVPSCSEEDTNSEISVGVPGSNTSEVVVKLLIKGEAILPPSTRQMSENTEGSYQDELQLFILEKQQTGTYIYNCHRPVEGTQGGFTVRVPSSLDSKDLKFLLFSNSKDIIGDPDQKFIEENGTNKNEDEIRKALLLTMNTQWDSSKRIPMWAEDTFTFKAPTNDASVSPVATLKLMRMLARVDVGLNYNGSDLSSTPQELSNFKLQKIKVHHSKDKGQLMPNTAAYETTGTGVDKVITIKTPSIPADGKAITPYEITVPDGSYASERDIYLFEQDMSLSQTGFDVNRTCILAQGEYTALDGITKHTGWYRLDFRDFGSEKGYANILRNKLYRFNITAVKGSGFATEGDALNSVSSNITVELLAMELNQNDIIFDGQSFLSVSKSELFFYKDRNTAGFSLNTNYEKGWEIETGAVSDITITPSSGSFGSSVVNLSWSPLPTVSEEREIYLKAGNLKKKLSLKYLHENGPGDLTNFSLDPPFLYFQKSGGTGRVNVMSNIAKKQLSLTPGNLEIKEVPAVIEANSFDVTVSPFMQTSLESVEQGAVNVHVQAANAQVTGQTIINQLTYDKQLTCTPPSMGHGLEDKASTVSMDIPYQTNEGLGTYLISFTSVDGGVASGPITSNPVNGTGTVRVSASQNKGSREREVGKLVFSPAWDGNAISLIGHTTKEVAVMQAPPPPPGVSINAKNDVTDLEWNQTSHAFTVSVDHPYLVDNNNVNITTLPKNKTIDMTVPSSGTLGTPVAFTMTPNRGDNPKSRTVQVSVDGHGDHVGEEQITFTQQAPAAPTGSPEMNGGGISPLDWNQTSFTLKITGLDNIYEINDIKTENVGSDERLNVTLDAGGFVFDANRETASMAVTFPQNDDAANNRTVKVLATVVGNRESVKTVVHNTLFQDRKRLGTINFNLTNPITIPHGGVISGGHVAVALAQNSIDLDQPIRVVKTSSDTSDWINLEVAKVTNAGVPGLEFRCNSATPNKGAARTAEVRIEATDRWGTIVTSGNKLTITQDAVPNGTLAFITTSHKFDASGGTFNYSLNISNVEKIQVEKPSWIKEATVQGNNLKVVASSNGGDVRRGTLKIRATNYAGGALEASATVEQRGPAGTLTITPAAQYLEYPGGTVNLTLNMSNVSGVRVSNKPAWITEATLQGNTLRVVVPSLTGAGRSGNITISARDYSERDLSASVDIRQRGDIVLAPDVTYTRAGGSQAQTVNIDLQDLSAPSARLQVTPIWNGDGWNRVMDYMQSGMNPDDATGRSGRLKFVVRPSIDNYNKEEANATLRWTTAGGKETRSNVKIIREGHPAIYFENATLSLPANGSSVKVNQHTTYNAAFISRNLKPGSSIWLEWTNDLPASSNQIEKVEFLDYYEDKVLTGFPANIDQKSTWVRVRITLTRGTSLWYTKGSVRIVGRGVDDAKKVLYSFKIVQ